MLQLDTCTNRMSTGNAVRIPKGEGRRGEGIRTAERRPGQSCVERWAGADSEMLPAHDGHLSLSEVAFIMEDDMETFEAAGAPPPRLQHPGVAPRDRSKSLSPTDVSLPPALILARTAAHPTESRRDLPSTNTTTPAVNQRRSPDSSNSDDLHYKSVDLHKAYHNKATYHKAVSYHDEGRWSTRGWEDSNPFLPPSMQLRLSPGKDRATSQAGSGDDTTNKANRSGDTTNKDTTNKATDHDDGTPPQKNEGRWAPPKGTPAPLVRDQDALSLDRAC